jgi:two-component system response regulator FixJ
MAKKMVALIGIVDDDESVRDSISSLLRSAGFKTASFESAEAFLDSDHKSEPDCLVLDVRMPGLSGLELQSQLQDRNSLIPIIFVTAHTEDEVRAKAMQQGATAFLDKPFSDEVLLGAINLAVRIHGPSAT